jgi:hypothetical protein
MAFARFHRRFRAFDETLKAQIIQLPPRQTPRNISEINHFHTFRFSPVHAFSQKSNELPERFFTLRAVCVKTVQRNRKFTAGIVFLGRTISKKRLLADDFFGYIIQLDIAKWVLQFVQRAKI